MDTLYFVHLDDALPQLMTLLKPGGRLVAFYTHAADPEMPIPVFPRETLPPNKTPLGVALERRGLPYTVQDFSASDFIQAARMLEAIEAARSALEAEGHTFLYESRAAEANGTLAAHRAGCAARYLYRVVKP